MADETMAGRPVPGDAAPDQPGPDQPGPDQPASQPASDLAEPVRHGQFWAGTLGAFSLVGGLTWILLNLHGPRPLLDIAVGVVLAAGGLVLLMPHRLRLPRKAAWITAAGAGLGGTVVGSAAASSHVCCMFAYVDARGFPFPWLRRGGIADDLDTARRLAANDRWSADVISLTANVLVWAYVGLLILALITMIRHPRGAR